MGGASVLTIILNWRTPDMTLRAAEAAMTAMQGIEGEILIVDNGSGDGSFETLTREADERGWTREGRLRVVSSGRNGGFGAGVNFGIQAGLATGAAPDFCYLLNSDAFPEPDAIRTLRDFLIATPDAGLAGSHVEGTDGKPHQTAFRFPSIASEFEHAAMTGLISRLLSRSIVAMPIPETAARVDWTAGASLLIRRQVFEQIGGFDETFFLYFEETDLCLRAARAGWATWYVPASRVAHVGSASTGLSAAARTPDYWFDSREHYFVKNHGHIYATVTTLAWIAGGTIWTVHRLLTGKPNRHRQGHMASLILHSLKTAFHPRPETAPALPCSHLSPEEKK